MNRKTELLLAVVALLALGFATGAAAAIGSWEAWIVRVPWAIVMLCLFVPIFFGRAKP